MFVDRKMHTYFAALFFIPKCCWFTNSIFDSKMLVYRLVLFCCNFEFNHWMKIVA